MICDWGETADPFICIHCGTVRDRPVTRRCNADRFQEVHAAQCQHRGQQVAEEECRSCGGNIKIKLFSCPLHGVCSIQKKTEAAAKICSSCEDFSVEETPFDPDNLEDYFDAVYVINLDRRPDRLEQFLAGLPDDWPFKVPERVRAIDGKKVGSPDFFSAGNGAWGCLRTHTRLVENALNNDYRRILIFEDDATFRDGFTEKVKTFLANMPGNGEWDMLYLGGQHLREKAGKPHRVNEHVYQPFNVNRTHAMAISLGDFGRKLYKWINGFNDWRGNHHIDHHLGRLHEQRKHRIFCPSEWLVGQAAGQSNINGREFSNDRFWTPATRSAKTHVSNDLFFAILGLHSSGSSALAGVCYHLGMHLGNKLVGFYGDDPDKSCGFEAVGLRNICEDVAKLRDTEKRIPSRKIEERLRNFINQKRGEGRKNNKVVGGKYPQLCACGDELQQVLGDRLRVIAADRPLEESIASIQRRCNAPGDEKLAAHQTWLYEEKERLISGLPEEWVLRVSYEDLLTDAPAVIARIAEFTGIRPTPEMVEKAKSYVDPEKRHVDLSTATAS